MPIAFFNYYWQYWWTNFVLLMEWVVKWRIGENVIFALFIFGIAEREEIKEPKTLTTSTIKPHPSCFPKIYWPEFCTLRRIWGKFLLKFDNPISTNWNHTKLYPKHTSKTQNWRAKDCKSMRRDKLFLNQQRKSLEGKNWLSKAWFWFQFGFQNII